MSAPSPIEGSLGPLSIKVTSNGTPLPETVAIASIDVRQAVNRIPSATLRLIDGNLVDDTLPVSDGALFAPGAAIVIQAGYEDVLKDIFSGIVVRHGVKFSGGNETRLVVECRDKALKMTVARKNANHSNRKDSEILAALISRHGLSSDVEATTVTHKELVQFDCTDWDFLMARAEANGLVVTVDSGKVSARAPDVSGSPVLSLTYGTDIVEFDAEMDASEQLESVEAVAWDPAKQAVSTQTAPPTALTGQGDLTSSTLAKVLAAPKTGLLSAGLLETGDLTAWAKARQLKAGLARIRGRVSFQGSALARPGGLVKLAGVGKRFEGNGYIGAVSHELRDGNWTTEVELGLASEWFASSREISSPPAAALLAAVPGLQIGVVKTLDGDPLGMSRIEVTVPLMQADTDGVWARLSCIHASDAFGAFFIPEVGDEVLLGYLHGDPSNPVVLGSLYSGKHAPAYPIAAANDTKAITTRTKMKLEFDEQKKVITLETPGKNTVVISDDGKSILLKDQNGNKVQMDASGILLDSPKDIVLKAMGNIDLQATQSISLKASTDVKVAGLNVTCDAQVSMTAKGAASAELSASGQTTVKGAMVMIN